MSTRKHGRKRLDDLRAEYDFRALGRGVRGKYFCRATAGTNLVLIDPDLVRAFPTGEAVNDALRMLSHVASAARQQDDARDHAPSNLYVCGRSSPSRLTSRFTRVLTRLSGATRSAALSKPSSALMSSAGTSSRPIAKWRPTRLARQSEAYVSIKGQHRKAMADRARCSNAKRGGTSARRPRGADRQEPANRCVVGAAGYRA